MTIEDRLRAHMQEQAERIHIESPGLSSSRPKRSPSALPVIAVAAALLFVMLSGAGFFLQSGRSPSVSEIAAGNEEDTQEAETDREPDDGGTALDVPATSGLEVLNVSDGGPPVFSDVVVGGDRYYALAYDDYNDYGETPGSTGLYILDGSGRWTTTDFGGRYILDLDVVDGVITVLSPGTASNLDPALGRSSDQGETWEWMALDAELNADAYSLVVTEQETLLYGLRFGTPDYEQAAGWLQAADLIADPGALVFLSSQSAAYIPKSAGDGCELFADQSARPLLAGALEAIDQASAEAVPQLEQEYLLLVDALKAETQSRGCGWDSAWDTVDGLRAFNESTPEFRFEDVIPEAISWDELGLTVPESWFDSSSLFRIDGQDLVELDLPFEQDQSGHPVALDGEMGIITLKLDDLGLPLEETLWSTADGLTWDVQTEANDQIREGGPLQFSGNEAHRLGDYVYRVWFGPLETGDVADTAALAENTEIEPPLLGGDGFESHLQRRRGADGPWETLDPAEFGLGLSLDDKSVDQLLGTPLGLFVVLVDHPVGMAPQGGVTVVHSSDGVTWEAFAVDADVPSLYGTDNSVLIMGWNWDDESGEPEASRAFLLTPTG